MVPDYLDSETFLSVMKETEGYICLLVRNVGASVYVRWNPERETFEWLSVSGPARTILMYETVSEEDIGEFVGGREPPQLPEKPVRYADTPFPLVPSVAGEYDERSYSMDGGVQVECGCGDTSMVYADEPSAQAWADRHREDCGATSCDINEIPAVENSR